MMPLILAVLLNGLLTAPLQSEADTFTFSHKDSLRVVSITAEGERIPGVTLTLCPYDGQSLNTTTTAEACTHQVTDGNGEASFQSIKPGQYAVVGLLEGFASTAVYPLSIKSSDPIAPDRVFLLLNPVCFDC